MLLRFSKQAKRGISLRRESKSRTQYIDVRKLSLGLSESLCEALIGYHAFTQWDAVRAFCGCDKTEPLKSLMKDDKLLLTLINLGKGWDVSQETLDSLETSMSSMSSKRVSVNDLRYELFVSKSKEADLKALPPCKDNLLQLIRRDNCVEDIWWRSSVCKYVPDPNVHG